MKAVQEVADLERGWSGPAEDGGGTRRRWNEALWGLICPVHRNRVLPTLPGVVLIGLAMGIGSAAYNASNNILFITLSLLLACLILSGVMSWLNLRRLRWRLVLAPPLRAGQETPVALELWNRRTLLPAYGLWFELEARPGPTGPLRPEATFEASGDEIRAILKRKAAETSRGTLPLRARLDPGEQLRLDWLFTPRRRGRVRVELAGVGTLFPFGFLRKRYGTRLRREAVVWPEPVEYRWVRRAGAARPQGGERLARPGCGDDLLAMRRYQSGDSHRLIHWKASARMRQLMVRQLADEGAAGYLLWVEAPPGGWARQEQFELLCRLAATLAEDLFTAGVLAGAAVNRESPIAVRQVRDLEMFLDRVAVLEAAPGVEAPAAGSRPPFTPWPDAEPKRRPLITFAPEGAREVAAWIHGEKAATT